MWTMRLLMVMAAALTGLWLAAGCDQPESTNPGQNATDAKPTQASSSAHPTKEADHESHTGHTHAAPHDGALVALGDHFAHLELVFDADLGAVTVYVLDGHAEHAVRIAAPSLMLEIDLGRDAAPDEVGEPLTMELTPVESALTGETAGDASEFAGVASALIGASAFEVRIARVEVLGEIVEDVVIRYPDSDE